MNHTAFLQKLGLGMKKIRMMKLQIRTLLCLLLMTSLTVSNAQNIKIFILAGQSNAQGHGEIIPTETNGTLSHFMCNGGDVEFGHLQNTDGSWATRNDVWVRFDDEFRDLLTGDLNVGFGANETQIGPELGLGHQLGDYSSDKILIIKTAWGGKSLAVDFRPPSASGPIFLDSRPSDPNLQFAQEFSACPSVVGVDDAGDVYARIIPPVYPKSSSNSSQIMRDISVYSLNAKWNAVEAWFNGGAVPATEMQTSGTLHVDFEIDNTDPAGVNAAIWTAGGPEIDTVINQFPYATIKTNATEKATFFEWDTNVVDDIGTGFRMPEFYKLTNRVSQVKG